MWYDWMAGGWGGRQTATARTRPRPIFGVGLAVQPVEAQERLTPVLTSDHEIVADSGGPGRFRGGCGVEKGGTLTEIGRTVMSYSCDRARSVTWGIEGGLPSTPHGVTLMREGEAPQFLGAVFSGVPLQPGDRFTRPKRGRWWAGRPAGARSRCGDGGCYRRLRHAYGRGARLWRDRCRDRCGAGRLADRRRRRPRRHGPQLGLVATAGCPTLRKV